MNWGADQNGAVNMAVGVQRVTDPRTGIEYVTLTAALPPLTPNGPATLADLQTRLEGLAPLIVGQRLAPEDPRLNIPGGLVHELAPPAELRAALGAGWLHTLLLELLELRRQLSKDYAAARLEAERQADGGLDFSGELTAWQRLYIVLEILRGHPDTAGDLRYAIEHLEAALVAVEQR